MFALFKFELVPYSVAIPYFGLVNFRCEGNRATVVQRPGERTICVG